MTSPRHAWRPPTEDRPPAEELAAAELQEDRRREGRLFWKGVLSLVVVIGVVWVRQRYLL